MTQRVRDFLIFFAAVALALCLGGVVRQLIGLKWDAAIFVGVLFLAAAVVKARWPQNAIMRGFSWRYVAATFALFAGIAVVLSDLSILRYWSIPVAILFFLAFCGVHLAFGPKDN
jgi:hypothetical protein